MENVFGPFAIVLYLGFFSHWRLFIWIPITPVSVSNIFPRGEKVERTAANGDFGTGDGQGHVSLKTGHNRKPNLL